MLCNETFPKTLKKGLVHTEHIFVLVDGFLQVISVQTVGNVYGCAPKSYGCAPKS